MIANKIDPLLQLALRYERLLSASIKENFIVDAPQNLWEIVMEYLGDLETITSRNNIQEAYDLNGGFAQITINKNDIGSLSNDIQVLRLSLPVRMDYMDIGLGQICASNLTQPDSTIAATGEGVLLAVIDSGIRYNHPDFITNSGQSRILYLWDQTIGEDSQAVNGGGGVVYTNAEINEALSYETVEEQRRIVPSQDTLGHGTALAGIAGGNGRGSSNARNKGVASGCELIIVKVANRQRGNPRDVDIMQGINFSIERASELRRPLIILLGMGNNLTGHDGTFPLERYMSRRYDNWLLNFVVGTGNEGNRSSHTSGTLQTGESQTIQISMSASNLSEYGCCIWKRFSDEISIEITAPNGEKTDELTLLTPNRAYLFGEVAVLINYTAQITSVNRKVIYILFVAQKGTALGNGLWTLTLKGNHIVEGSYEVWGSIVPQVADNRIEILNPNVEKTLVSPATAEKITSVGAYNRATRQVDAFSGRGFTADGRVAPDIVAPGVNITAPSSEEESLYRTITGTSAAAAFVAGAYAVMMGYGVFTLNNLNYYGEDLRIYLLRNAQRPPNYAPYPNNSWGYGLICVQAALINMKEFSEQTT